MSNSDTTTNQKSRQAISLAGKPVGRGHPVWVAAEMSANHDRDLKQALALVDSAADAGADAVKLQTYDAASLTLRTDHPSARIDPIWGSPNLYELYARAAMPYEFHQPIFERCQEKGLTPFCSVYAEKDVDFLEKLGNPIYKIASFELVHLPLLRLISQTRKPVILSTGMANLGEIEEAVAALRSAHDVDLVLLHCCSSYPAPPEQTNLAAMATLEAAFGCPVGFSDHTLGCSVATAAAALGACMIEKHYTNDQSRPGPDHRFSATPEELKALVAAVRSARQAIGSGQKVMAACESESRRVGRRSLYATVDIPANTVITGAMVAVVRPGEGLHPRFLETVVGRTARQAIPAGSPITWEAL